MALFWGGFLGAFIGCCVAGMVGNLIRAWYMRAINDVLRELTATLREAAG